MNPPLIVLKFGSSVLSDRSFLPVAVHEIYRYYRGGYRVLVVVSAIGRHTDLLLDEARRIASVVAPDAALAALLATGEQQSAALLTIVLHRAGVQSTLLSPACIGLTLSGDRLDASPVSVDTRQLQAAFSLSRVLVLPGFFGIHEQGGSAVMGRGGSDLTAVFLAERLGADECRLLKDVDGIYERDPGKVNTEDADDRPHHYAGITYEEALRVSRVLVQPKAVQFLQAKTATARVCALLCDDGTDIGTSATSIRDTAPKPPLRVLLLGLGVVGAGVYEHLQQLSQYFEVVGIYVRDLDKERGANVRGTLLGNDISELLARPHDLVVDVCGDPVKAHAAIAIGLAAGRPCVTASKRLVADRGAALAVLASEHGTQFRYSAAVGGSAPMIEMLEQALEAGPIVGLRGVLSGTCNFVLDRMSEGAAFERAVAEAQSCGFAEADAARDLSGEDSEDKLRILARRAFGSEHDSRPVRCEGLRAVTSRQLAEAWDRGEAFRLVATFEASGRASVQLEALAADDYLAGARREENRLVITGADGREWKVSGKGAGRWPTAEAVVADMIEIRMCDESGYGSASTDSGSKYVSSSLVS